MKKLFFGGIHPADKKELTCDQRGLISIEPEYVILPMSQHIGASCKPLVKVGDRVLMGQKIGDNEGLCAPIHASVSGTVVEIEPMPHVNGSKVQSVMIKNDHQNLWDESVKPHVTELFKIIREAGIVGMGGATFPTEVKVSSSKDKIDTLIINACECEPYITADDMLIRRNPEQILKGIGLLANELNPEQTFLAIEDNKVEAIDALKKHLHEYPMIQFQVLKTRYPQGSEKQLILSLTGREVPPGQLPASVGCAVFNVSTTAAVANAVYEGKPLVRRIVTVTGEGIANPRNFDVPIGTPFSVLIEAAGGLTKKCRKVIAGGPMMGRAQTSLDVPVIKGTGAILCLEEDADFDKKCRSGKYYEEMHPTCIRCGKCVEVCPMYLQPLYLYRYSNTKNLNMLEKYNLMDCIECGCCAYTCPGKLPLVDSFRAGKLVLREKK